MTDDVPAALPALRPDELQDLRAATTRKEWNDVCMRVTFRVGGYPPDWDAKVVDSGLWDRACTLPEG